MMDHVGRIVIVVAWYNTQTEHTAVEQSVTVAAVLMQTTEAGPEACTIPPRYTYTLSGVYKLSLPLPAFRE